MRNKILLNERYGAVEIDKNGTITRFNNTAFAFFSDIFSLNIPGDLKGENIIRFSEIRGSQKYSNTDPEKIISAINGIMLIDTVFYRDTESVIARFVMSNNVFTPFFEVIKFSSSLFFELDNDQNIIFASESFCKKTGVEKSDIYGAHISIFADNMSTGKIISTLMLYKDSIIDRIKLDQIIFSFGGIAQNYDLVMSPVADGKGVLSGILCYLSDINAEMKYNMINRNIRRIRAMANFAGSIAHDYNNALTAVLGNISLAKMDAEKGSELEELLRDVESAGLKIKMLTERLGLFARGLKLVKSRTDFKRMIENTVSKVFSGYKGKYTINIQEIMGNPEINPELICEAIEYVIENAIDSADKPDGKIIIEVKETEINQELIFRETSLVPGSYIFISVRDNGPGIDPLVSGEIFDPYVTTKEGRDGLGLALTYTILKRHRGFISAAAPDNGGAQFDIYIPLF